MGWTIRSMVAVACLVTCARLAGDVVTIPGLFNTGVDGRGNLLPGGTIDPHYRLIQSADAAARGPKAFVVNEGYPIPPWLTNGPRSKWIAPKASQTTGNAAGDYVYRMDFDLTGLEPSSARLIVRWSTDNGGLAVRLNGADTGLRYDGNFGALSAASIIERGFVSGSNTLDFVVNNGGTDANPTGLRVEVSGSAEVSASPDTPPSIRIQPQSLKVGFKQAATFEVVAYGAAPLSYQWRRNGKPVVDATNAAYRIPFVGVADIGAYDVTVRNPIGSVVSSPATLEVLYPPRGDQAREPIGPASRRTGLVISELHYQPAPRTDGRRLEFVELYNTNPFFEDIGGWQLTGEVEFTFPEDTQLEGRSYLVVGGVPADLVAVYGPITNLYGPFRGKLANEGGVIRLKKKSGGVVLEVPYRPRAPWPVAAAGLGHSLVLSRPSFGEADPRAWSASASTGGSPGTLDAVSTNVLDQVCLNELMTSETDGPTGFVEVFNRSPQPVDLSGCALESLGQPAFRIPAGTQLPPRSALAFAEATLGFRLNGGEAPLALWNPDRTRVLDVIIPRSHLAGVAFGRHPDGAEEWAYLAEPTPSERNSGRWAAPVVISELMYHPPKAQSTAEFVELYNRTESAIDLSGWRLQGGIDYTFAAPSLIPPGGYLAVAKDTNAWASLPAERMPNFAGNYVGSLSDSGETVVLAMPLTATEPQRFVAIDEVTYGSRTGRGRWAEGAGSSLERIDLREAGALAGNWADSEEASRHGWVTVEATGILDHVHPGVPAADQLQIILLGAGEVLVDNVEVLVAGVNRVTNGTFEAGLSGWSSQGTHRRSFWETTNGFGSQRSLHVVASDRGDHVANRIRAPVRPYIPKNNPVTLRAQVRWLRGRSQILLRLRGGGLEAVGVPQAPSSFGTPATANSVALSNAGPSVAEVRHEPVLPQAGELIRVSARVEDRDGIGSVRLQYRLDPAKQWRSVTMTDDGLSADEFPGDGVFTAAIPSQVGGSLVAFYVEATDAAMAPASSRFPNDAPTRECLVRVGEPSPQSAFGTYHLWITPATQSAWANRERMSNEDVDATFVYGANRVIYNTGAHYSGSSYTSPTYDSPVGNLCGYDLNFPANDRLLGSRHLTLDWPIRDTTNQREQLMYWFLEQYGLPNMYRRYVHLFVNGLERGIIYDDVQQPGDDTLEEWFPGDAEGTLLKTDCWNEFDDGGSRVEPCVLNTLENFTTTGGRKKVARYRWNWRPRALHDEAADFSSLFALVDSMNRTNGYVPGLQASVDVDHWMRTFAMNDLASFWDAFGNPNAKNTFLYKPTHDRWKLMCWDFDVGLGCFNDPPSAPLFDVNDPTVLRMYRTPALVRPYWAALQEALDGFFRTGSGTAIDQRLDARYAAFRADGLGLASPAPIKTWIGQRRSYLLAQLNTVRSTFAVTTQGGADFATDTSPLVLTGTAPVNVRTITVNGVAYPLTWLSVNRWSLTCALESGLNPLRVQGLDRFGLPLTNAAVQLNVMFTGDRPELSRVRINEWMCASRGFAALDAVGSDWFELYNPTGDAVPLERFWVSDDLNDPAKFVIPPGFVLPPQGHLRVWADDLPELTAQTGQLHVNFRLNQDGEVLSIHEPDGRLADRVVFGRQLGEGSEGRWPDGAPEPFYGMELPTPGSANDIAVEARPVVRLSEAKLAADGRVTLSWAAQLGRRYRVYATDRLPGGSWLARSDLILAEETTASFTDPDPVWSQTRFYRVALEW